MMEQIPRWARAVVAVVFIATFWSVFTGFSLGEILNKYADANLKQNEMQFQAQIHMQQMQHEATERSNAKLDDLLASVNTVATQLNEQAEQMSVLAQRLLRIEATTTLVVRWSCAHAKQDRPQYCAALPVN